MKSFQQIVEEHRARYPEMQLQDICKLAYQNEYGCGHLVKNEEAARLAIFSEAATANPGKLLIEPIGNGYARIYLGSAREIDFPIEWILRMFLDAAKVHTGSAESFCEKARTVCYSNEIDQMNDLLEMSRAQGFAPFSHSAEYRDAYRPGYRVINSIDAALVPLLISVSRQMQNNRTVLVAIDGRCGSGKSTLSKRFEAITGFPVVHADDFFLPMELRTPERFSQPGGNIHYERLIEEVLEPAALGRSFTYGQFSCSQKRIESYRTVEASTCVLVEGSYSLHPSCEHYYAVKAFCDITREEQQERILKRNGAESLKMFVNRWIPLEEAYFSGTDIKNRCSLIIQCE